MVLQKQKEEEEEEEEGEEEENNKNKSNENRQTFKTTCPIVLLTRQYCPKFDRTSEYVTLDYTQY